MCECSPRAPWGKLGVGDMVELSRGARPERGAEKIYLRVSAGNEPFNIPASARRGAEVGGGSLPERVA